MRFGQVTRGPAHSASTPPDRWSRSIRYEYDPADFKVSADGTTITFPVRAATFSGYSEEKEAEQRAAWDATHQPGSP